MHLAQPADPRWRARLEAKMMRAPSGCWIWIASRRPDGYGQIWTPSSAGPRRLLSAHRAVYEAWVGAIPTALDLDHLCRVRRCVNPIHLQPVTRRTNILRGQGRAAANARRARCLRGHPLPPPSPAVRKRSCATCRADRRQRATAA